jgi:hypothetical protein
VELVDRPFFYPGLTIQGRSGGPAVDTGCELAAGGHVYIDRLEAHEIARHFGFAAPDEVSRLRGRLEEAVARVNELEAQLRRIGNVAAV